MSNLKFKTLAILKLDDTNAKTFYSNGLITKIQLDKIETLSEEYKDSQINDIKKRHLERIHEREMGRIKEIFPVELALEISTIYDRTNKLLDIFDSSSETFNGKLEKDQQFLSSLIEKKIADNKIPEYFVGDSADEIVRKITKQLGSPLIKTSVANHQDYYSDMFEDLIETIDELCDGDETEELVLYQPVLNYTEASEEDHNLLLTLQDVEYLSNREEVVEELKAFNNFVTLKLIPKYNETMTKAMDIKMPMSLREQLFIYLSTIETMIDTCGKIINSEIISIKAAITLDELALEILDI